MHDQGAGLKTWAGKVLRHYQLKRLKNATSPEPREPHHLERIASCACSGYFHAGYTLDSFVFNAELPFRN